MVPSSGHARDGTCYCDLSRGWFNGTGSYFVSAAYLTDESHNETLVYEHELAAAGLRLTFEITT